MSDSYRPNDPTIRRVVSKVLKEEEIASLDGAMIFEPNDLDAAIIAAIETPDGHVALYDYDKLWRLFYDSETEESTPEQAQEYVDYNLVRGLPYMGRRAPLIGLWVNNEDGEEYGDDVEYIRHGGKIYVRL